jgi:hypothetical protein
MKIKLTNLDQQKLKLIESSFPTYENFMGHVQLTQFMLDNLKFMFKLIKDNSEFETKNDRDPNLN